MQNIVLVGDGGTGKTSFVLRVAKDYYTDSYMSTIGKEMTIVDNLIIHDTSGHPRFSSPCEEYYKHANGALVFCDNNYNSAPWIKKLRKSNPDIPIMVVINKIDLIDIKTDDSELEHIHISCKTGENVNMVLPSIKEILTPAKTSPAVTWIYPYWNYCLVQ